MTIVEVIAVLNGMVQDGVLEGYAIGGAVGATFYLEPVATVDLDVFVRLGASPGKLIANPQPIFAYLAARGHKMEGEYVWIGDWPVQFLGLPGALGEEAYREAKSMEVAGTAVRVFSPEHLALIALQTGRAKDKARLLSFIEVSAIEMVRFENIVSRHGLTQQWDTFRAEFLEGTP